MSRAALLLDKPPLNAGDVDTPNVEAVLVLILSAAAATTLSVEDCADLSKSLVCLIIESDLRPSLIICSAYESTSSEVIIPANANLVAQL
jgi:hypothetical protein